MIITMRVLSYLLVIFMACENASAKARRIDVKNENVIIRFHIYFPIYGRIDGRFDRVRGRLDLDEKNPNKSKINIEVDTASVNSNHELRDAYLRSAALLSTQEYPTAFFRSDTVKLTAKNTILISGYLTLRGVTRPVTVRSFLVGKTFQGTTSVYLSKFGIYGLPGFMFTKLHLSMRLESRR